MVNKQADNLYPTSYLRKRVLFRWADGFHRKTSIPGPWTMLLTPGQVAVPRWANADAKATSDAANSESTEGDRPDRPNDCWHNDRQHRAKASPPCVASIREGTFFSPLPSWGRWLSPSHTAPPETLSSSSSSAHHIGSTPPSTNSQTHRECRLLSTKHPSISNPNS